MLDVVLYEMVLVKHSFGKACLDANNLQAACSLPSILLILCKVRLRHPGAAELADVWRLILQYLGTFEAHTIELADFWKVRLCYPGTVELADVCKAFPTISWSRCAADV